MSLKMYIGILFPMVCGIIVAIINSEKIYDYDKQLTDWLISKRNSISKNGDKAERSLIQPLLSALLKISEWTESISHVGLKTGIRLASYLYIVSATILILSVIVYIAIAVLIIWLATLLSFKYLSREDSDAPATIGISASSSDNNSESVNKDKKNTEQSGEKESGAEQKPADNKSA